MKQRFSTEILLAKTGGFYIMLVIAAAQLLAFPGAILGAISIQLSAGFSSAQLRQISGMTPVLVLTGNLILLIVAWFMTPNARKKLSMIVSGSGSRVNPDQEFKAWKEITGLTWRYGAAAVPIAYLVVILPSSLYYYLNRGNLASAIQLHPGRGGGHRIRSGNSRSSLNGLSAHPCSPSSYSR